MWNSLIETWQACLVLAWESYCEGSIPIASVVVNSEGNIISRGRNRKSTPFEANENQIGGGPLAHAEINALLALDWSNTDPYAIELYTTVEPCPLCIGAICMSGVKKFRYAARDTWSGSTNLLNASPYLQWKSIQAIPPADPKLETIIHMMQVEGQLAHNHPRAKDVLRKWSEFYPEDVHKGRYLFDSGELTRMRSEGIPARDVIDRLYELADSL
jgi:tRNA(adenine34) deaminase